MSTREEFIATYVERRRGVGFDIQPTHDGCIYAAEPEWDEDEIRMIAAPCACEGHDEGWHMIEADSEEGKLHA